MAIPLALLALAAATPTSALANENCPRWFKAFASLFRRNTPLLTPEERTFWQKTFTPQRAPDLGHLFARTGDDPDAFWLAYRDLPEEVRRKLEGGETWKHLFELRNEAGRGLTDGTFLQTVEKYALRLSRDEEPEHFGRIAGAQLQRLETRLAQDPLLESRLRQIAATEAAAIRAEHLWNEDWGVVALPLVSQGKSQFVQIDGHLWPAVRRGTQWEITIKRDLVQHANWNPISLRTLIKKAEEASPPPFYPAVLGADGRFYLTDRNHNFSVDPAGIVRVQVSDPIQTVSIRQYFDLLGIPQPSRDRLVEVMEGKRRIRDLMPEFLWERSVLLHGPVSTP